MRYWFTLICAVLIALSVTLVVKFNKPEVSPQASAPITPALGDASQTPPIDPATDTQKWAESIEKPGLPNFYRVSDTLYRGAQPTEEGIRELKDMGVRTIVNLRSFHSDRDEIDATGLAYEHIYMKAWHPEEKEVVRFLQIVSDENRTPVFVHCQHGADRTGTMVAVYRMVMQGWSREDALREMTEGPYGFHEVWENLEDFLQKLDMEKIREKAGIPSVAPAPASE